MKVKFKKRFRTLAQFAKFTFKYLRVGDNKSMSCMFNKSYSKDRKKMYINVTGWFERESKEG